MNTLFVKTYKENDFFRGDIWICQPIDHPWSNKLQRPSYEGGGSGDTESEAIAKCFAIYKDTYAKFYKVTRKGKLD
tara:strand:+ start:1157 stop:1384 length:228 start_codon:yes stop_codon:yes gene_type:complete